MEFKEIASLFLTLEKTSKRLNKILILRDFQEKNPIESSKIFDIIAGNYQRELDKKKLGISLKTIFLTLSFISKQNQELIEKEFNKIGDIGELSQKLLKEKRQQSLQQENLTLNKITLSLESIANISGTNANKKKKEILTNLFLQAKTDIEYKYLSRFLINDLRVGVSEGVLKEAMINYLFPKIIGIHLICPNCNYINLNMKECLKCQTKLDEKNQDELASKKFEIVELTTPKTESSLLKYNIEYEYNPTEFALRRNKEKHIIKTANPREIYNNFLQTFEKKYNLLNSFQKITKELNQNIKNITKFEIEIGNPIKSMLGTRAKTITESFEMTAKPALIDFKYDGLRVQIHNNFGNVTLFSRNLEEITKQFPEVIEFIKTNFSDLSFVIDSECIGYNYDTQKFLPFQTLSKRILTKNIDEVKHINVIVKSFDILYLNGETLIEKPYKERREILQKIILKRKLKQKLHFNINNIK